MKFKLKNLTLFSLTALLLFSGAASKSSPRSFIQEAPLRAASTWKENLLETKMFPNGQSGTITDLEWIVESNQVLTGQFTFALQCIVPNTEEDDMQISYKEKGGVAKSAWANYTDDHICYVNFQATNLDFLYISNLMYIVIGTGIPVPNKDENFKAILYTGYDVPIADYFETPPDFEGPLISGTQTEYRINVDSPITVAQVKTKLRAVDETDGDVTASIVVKEDNYTGKERILGDHQVTFAAYDKANNESLLHVNFKVLDQTMPVINGPKTLRFGYGSPTTIDAILLQYSATDNHSTGLKVTVESDNYTVNKNKVGNYSITFACSDLSANKATLTVPVEVYDNVAPVITGPSTIEKNNNVALTISDILKQFTASDAVDGAVAVKIKSDNYTGFGNKVGTYTIVVETIDHSNNTATKTLTINVVDNLPPVWYVDATVIHIADTLTLSENDLIKTLRSVGEIKPQTASVTVSSDAYAFGEKNKVGTYGIKIVARYFDGSENTLNKVIEVYSTSDSIQSPGAWYKTIYNDFLLPIGNFFIDCWNKLFNQKVEHLRKI